ncbi:flagellar basal-body MS-ring/collar protein FliF [Microbacterium sp. GXF7504]
MPTAVKGVLDRLKQFVAGFSVAQRTIALIGAAVLVMGVVALGAWLSRPTLTPLFSGLSASDANAVVEQLRSASVQYELTDGGSTILVPQDAVYEQRLVAAAAGLPSSSSEGYSLLDEMGVTSSEFQQSVTYKRAIEGELAATIGSLEGVSAASVKLAIPEESVFVSEAVEPTASVFVKTRNNATLSQKQVEAIVHLTAAAVSGMPPANVAVVDQSGNTLSAVGVDAAGGVDQAAGDYETRVAAGVKKLLETVVGPGKATVTVIADIDRSVTEQLSEVYTPAEGAPPASEQVRTETQTGGTGGAGVLGPDNIAVPDGADGAYESSEETRNNVINKTVESRTTPAGSVTRQSVSVAVDTEAAEGVGMAKLRELVASAAGIDTDRGDQITVELVRFSSTDAEAAQAALKAAEEEAAAERNAAILKTVIVVAAVLLVIGAIAAFLIVRARRRARPVEEEFDKLFGDRPPPLSALPAFDTAAATATPPTPPAAEPPTVPMQLDLPAAEETVALEIDPDPGPAPAQISLQRRRAEIDALARTDPKRTADLLRRLLDERQPV